MNNINQDLERTCVEKQARGQESERPRLTLRFPFTIEQVSPNEIRVEVVQFEPVITAEAFNRLVNNLGENIALEIERKLNDEFNRQFTINSITIIK